MSRLRCPLLPSPYGQVAVVSLCGMEVTALTVGHVPTVTSVVRRHPLIGVGIVAWLVHHWFVERASCSTS